MSDDSNAPPTSMDVDQTNDQASGAGNQQVGANAGNSSAIPSSAGTGSGAASGAQGSGSSGSAGASTSSSAMDTDAAPHKAEVTISTDQRASGSAGAPSKRYYGAFARYSAKHPVATSSGSGSGQSGREKSSSSRADVVAPASFDLAQAIAPYSGITVVDRLIYIAERCSSLSRTAYQMALDELLQTENTTLYRYLAERLAGQPGFRFDMSTIDAKQAQSAQQFERLELELSSYKANLIKDNVRMSSREMGDFHFARGDYGAALRAYSRMRDYCSTPAHHTDMNVCQARACLQLSSYSQLLTHVSRAEQQPDLEPALANQLKCWTALSYLHDRKFKLAARRFIEVKAEKLPPTINQTITVNDIAKYATLLGLAEFDRNELNTRILSNSEFGQFLEKEPQMLQLAKSFYESQYGTCMGILDQIVPELRLDFRLGDHIDTLVKHIRARALTQYFTPFSTVDLNEMARAFNMTVPNLEKELADLIVSGQISARIDSHNKRLYATQSDQRTATFDKSYNAADDFRSQSMAMLLRINLIRNGFVVKGAKGQGGAGMDIMDIPMAFGGFGGMAGLMSGMGRSHKGR